MQRVTNGKNACRPLTGDNTKRRYKRTLKPKRRWVMTGKKEARGSPIDELEKLPQIGQESKSKLTNRATW